MPIIRTLYETLKIGCFMKLIIYRFCLLICILSLTISCKRKEKKFVVGVSHSSINDSWRKAMVLDMQVKA